MSGNGKEILQAILAGAMEQHGRSDGDTSLKPATMAQIRGLLEGIAQKPFVIGDIVQVRGHAADRFKFPKADDKCIVTQLVNPPYRTGNAASTETALVMDFGVAFYDADDERVIECLYDSRHFVKVGSIYDPVLTASGEELAVE